MTKTTQASIENRYRVINRSLSQDAFNDLTSDLFSGSKKFDAKFRYDVAAGLMTEIFAPKCLQFRDPTKEGRQLMIYDQGTYVDGMELLEQALLYLGGNVPKKRTRECVYDVLLNGPNNKIYQEDVPTKRTRANFKNGIVDISGDEPVLIEHTPDEVFFSQIPNNYDDTSSCELFDKYLTNTLDEKYHEFIYEWIGYCLFESYELQYILFLHGVPRAGKSTLQRLIDHIVGEHNSSSLSLEQMNNEPHSTASLLGKLINNAGEVNYRDLKKGVGTLNQLSGGDSITVNPKYKALLTFVNRARLIFSMNHLPKIYDDSDGFYRRVKRVEYKKEMTQEEMAEYYDPENGLFTDACICAVIHKSVAAYHKLVQQNATDFTMKTDVEITHDRYRTVSDSLSEFLFDCVTIQEKYRIDPDAVSFVTNAEIYGVYVSWCEKRRVSQKKYTVVFCRNGVAPLLTELGATRKVYNNIRGWEYVLLNDAEVTDGYQETLEETVC